MNCERAMNGRQLNEQRQTGQELSGAEHSMTAPPTGLNEWLAGWFDGWLTTWPMGNLTHTEIRKTYR